MQIIGIAFLLILLLITVLITYICIAEEKKEAKKDSVIDYTKVTCEKCSKSFMFDEQKALVKYKNGTKYITNCPYCNKLTKVNIDY